MTKESDAPRSVLRSWKLWTGMLLFLCVVAAAGFYAFNFYTRGGVTFTLESVSLPRPPSNGGLLSGVIGDVTSAARAVTGTGPVIARVIVKNSAPVSAVVKSASYTAVVNGREVGRGNWTAPGSLVLSSGQEAALDLPFNFDSKSLAAGAIDMIKGQPVSFKLKGEAKVSIWGTDFSAPFSLSPMQVDVFPSK